MVKIGSSYLTKNAAKDFVHFFARSMKNNDVSEVVQAKFFSIFIDGSTDKGNVHNELMMVCWRDTSSEDKKLHTKFGFLAVERATTTRVSINLYGMGCIQQLGISDIN